MKPAQANLINGVILVCLGLWGYLSTMGTDASSPTALIAPAFGLLFLLLTPPFKNGNKAVAHIVVVLTLLILIALVKPFSGALGGDDFQKTLRVGTMMVSCLIALVIYIMSFVKARRSES